MVFFLDLVPGNPVTIAAASSDGWVTSVTSNQFVTHYPFPYLCFDGKVFQTHNYVIFFIGFFYGVSA
jgi:hypothetical protein